MLATLKTRIISKHSTEAEWLVSEIIPFKGELIVYDPDELHEAPRLKIGDGIHLAKDLPFQPTDITNSDFAVNDSDDPAFIKNRTHYKEENLVSIEVLPETTLSAIDMDGDEVIDSTYMLDYSLEITPGTMCTVKWRGTEYVTPAVEIENEGTTGIVIGDIYTATGGEIGTAPTGDPFVIVAANDVTMIMGFDGLTDDLTISIITTEDHSVYHKLDKNYIPDEVVNDLPKWVEASSSTEIMPETQLIANGADSNGVPDNFIMTDEIDLVVGNKYIVTFNGVAYESEAIQAEIDGMSTICLGDMYTFSGGEIGAAATGEPFVLMYVGPNFVIEGATGVVQTDATSVTMSIATLGETKRVIEPSQIKDMYYEEDDTVEILPRTEFDASASQEIPVGTAIELAVGKTYEADYCGAIYQCIAREWIVGGAVSGIAIGNVEAVSSGQMGEGEPFCLVSFSPDLVAQMPAPTALLVLDNTVSGTISVCSTGTIVHKIPEKYLPEISLPDTLAYIEELGTDICPETYPIKKDNQYGLTCSTDKIVLGGTYTIMWNGVEYICEAKGLDLGSEATLKCILGNQRLFGGEDTGEPFLMMILSPAYAIETGVTIMLLADDSVSHAIATIPVAITHGAIYHKLDEKLLPDSIVSQLETLETTTEEHSAAISELQKIEVPTKMSELENDAGYLTSYTESDPTVPAWAKSASKPTYTAAEVGALPDTTVIPNELSDLSDDTNHRTVTDEEKAAWNAKSDFSGSYSDLSGKPELFSGSYNDLIDKPTIPSVDGLASEQFVTSAVSTHNASTDSHNDIRLLIDGLTTRLNTLADSDDTTLDQMSELVAYIKSNKELIDDITTNKVNVSDIIDNLTTNVINKPLSAAQGVVIKGLIDALQKAVDSKAASSSLTSHTSNTSNPHAVTKVQVGLSRVNNTADSEKTVKAANQLTTARNISITGGATSTATAFDGTSDISIPVTDVKESYISWGGKTIIGKTSVLDDVASGNITNCFAFLPLDGVNIEYSRDGGTTWTAGTPNASWFLSPPTGRFSITKPYTTNDKIRITIDNSISKSSCTLKKLLLKVYNIGVTINATIEYFSISNGQDVLQSTQIVEGVDSWSSIPFEKSFHLKYKLRITLEVVEVEEHNNPGFAFEGLIGIGSPISGSNMAKTGHLYYYDTNQNATFPARVTATQFIEGETPLSYKYVVRVSGKGLSTNDYTTAEKNKLAGLATVATSGDYNHLTNKPTIPAAVTVDSALSSTSTNPVQNKVINTALSSKAPSSHTHSKSEITDFPTLATVATSGSYNDLSDKPAIPTTLANPNALTFTGNTEGTYDGSSALSVRIPTTEEIAALVIEQLGGQPVFGYIDENNTITLNSLSDGTYTLKYEQSDGTTTEIGSLLVGEVAPAYTNLFNPDTATLNQRWSNSSFAFVTGKGTGHFVTDYIPVTLSTDTANPTVMHFRGATFTNNAHICFYNSSKSIINSATASTNGAGMHVSTSTVSTDENGDYQVSLGYKSGKFDSSWTSGVAYMRVGLYVSSATLTTSDVQNVIITVNELITD